MIAASPIQLIVVGTGLIGPRHAQHILSNPNTELVAIIDPSPKADDIAEGFNTPKFDSLDEFFSYLDAHCIPYPDGALVCTPNHLHSSIAAQLAGRGVHLLVEKPVSSDLEDAKALKEYVAQQNVHLLVGHHRRFNPFIVAAKQSLDTVGEIIAIQGTWTVKKPDDYFTASPWRTDSKTGGGALLINLVHDIDILQYLFGPIERVYAESLKKQRLEYPNIDEGACITLKFENGVTGIFLCSDNVTSPFNFEAGTGENPLIPVDDMLEGFYKVFGSKGTLSIPDFTLYHQPDVPEDEQSWNQPLQRTTLIGDRAELRQTMPFETQLNHFVDVIRGKVMPACTADDGISALLCIEAVTKSLKTGLPQSVQKVHDISPNFGALGVQLHGKKKIQ